jgi:hypothetical protein
MDAARAAGRFFVDLSNANDQLGAVSFQRRDQNGDGSIVEPDELAEQVFPPNLIAEGAIDRRNSMRNDISGIAPDTSPGFIEPESSSPIAISPPGVTYHTDAKHAVYRIRAPEPGLRIYTVEPKVLSAEFFAVASAPTSLTARVGPGQFTRRAGGDYSMPFRVWVADDDAILNTTVAGFVRRPDGVKDTINLRDNGASMDGARNDGIYGLEYIASIPGAYSVDLKASGIARNGEPFERYLLTAFYVPGDHKRPDQAGEGGTPRTPAGPCGGPVRCCWLWFAFFVALILSMLFFLRTACPCTETTHIFSRPRSLITALIMLLVAIILGWWLLNHCTIALR